MHAVRLGILLLVLGGLTWAFLEPSTESAGGLPPRPNVLLVSIDSLRGDHLGSYGYERPTTPTIDRLAREGALFESAISPASWTVPAHMTLLTALPPEVHRIVTHDRSLDPAAVTLAEALGANGYSTHGFVSGPTVMAHYGFDQGFDSYDETMVERTRNKANRGVSSPGLVTLVLDELARWNEAGRQKPFFIFLHMWDVHYDYDPPPPYDRMFDPEYAGTQTFANFETNESIRPEMDARDLHHLIARYDGEIRFTDDHLGRIVGELEALRALDDTIVVVTSDHGDEFFEHGFKGHGKTLYDEIIHIPLVVRYPRRIAAGQRVPEQVRLMDVAPTILSLSGAPLPAGFGVAGAPSLASFVDLAPRITSPEAHPLPPLPAFSESTAYWGSKWSIRTLDAKLIKYDRDRFRWELFDLRADPDEETNVVHSRRRTSFPQAKNRLAEWHAFCERQPKHAVVRQPTRKHAARLRALGYLE